MDPGWKNMPWGYEVSSRDELFRAIHRVGTLEASRRYVWRGVPSRHFSVRSSLLRDLAGPDAPIPTEAVVRTREEQILATAREWGVGAELGATATDLHLLALLQHYGLPTRLIDVTSNPYTALWFACQSAKGDGESDDREAAGLLLAFDVTSMVMRPTIDIGPGTWFAVENPVAGGLVAALDTSSSDQQPFLVRPSLPDIRMTVQEGLFIAGITPAVPSVPGVESFGLGEVYRPDAGALAALFAPDDRRPGRPRRLPFLALVIPPRLKARTLNSLRGTFNRRRRFLFPDLAGLSEAFRLGQLDA